MGVNTENKIEKLTDEQMILDGKTEGWKLMKEGRREVGIQCDAYFKRPILVYELFHH